MTGKEKECLHILKGIAYCSMMGQDLEHNQQAWDEVSKLYDPYQELWVISDETQKKLELSKIPLTDKGVFFPLIRTQQVFMGAQCGMGAAGHKIHKRLETITSTTPRDMERLRNQELLMRNFVK